MHISKFTQQSRGKAKKKYNSISKDYYLSRFIPQTSELLGKQGIWFRCRSEVLLVLLLRCRVNQIRFCSGYRLSSLDKQQTVIDYLSHTFSYTAANWTGAICNVQCLCKKQSCGIYIKFPCSLKTNYQKRPENREQRPNTRNKQSYTYPHKLNIPVRIIGNRSINFKKLHMDVPETPPGTTTANNNNNNKSNNNSSRPRNNKTNSNNIALRN